MLGKDSSPLREFLGGTGRLGKRLLGLGSGYVVAGHGKSWRIGGKGLGRVRGAIVEAHWRGVEGARVFVDVVGQTHCLLERVEQGFERWKNFVGGP